MRFITALTLLLTTPFVFAAEPSRKPNIVVIYADDIGYGDLGCYGATKVKTPHCDKLAEKGLKFTDGHSIASVCTPSRYSLTTGEYAFRKKGTGIASGIQSLLIDPKRMTLPSMLQGAGYTTGIVGKWHLGLGDERTDYNKPINLGPKEIGYDYSWIMPATGDRVPCVWVENGRVVNLDPKDPITLDYSVQRGEPRSFLKGIPRIGAQTGGKAALWNDEEMSLDIAGKSCDFMEKNKANPFFLLMATHNIHVPRSPNKRFLGKSDCGIRGDAIVEFDWMVGEVLGKLEKLGLAENTLVILSSDNGGINDDNGPDKVHGIGDPDGTNGHKQNGVLRGTKGTVFEGGTRVPFIVRWPARVKPGTSDALMSHMDWLACLASLTGREIPLGEAPDSENHLGALLGENKTGRETLIEQSNGGAPFGFRQGTWKLVPPGMAKKGANKALLFDLSKDLSETKNLAEAQPECVAAMTAKLEEIVTKGTKKGKGSE